MGKHNRSQVGTTEFKEISWLPVVHMVAEIKLNLAIKRWNELPKEIKFVTKEHKFKGAV